MDLNDAPPLPKFYDIWSITCWWLSVTYYLPPPMDFLDPSLHTHWRREGGAWGHHFFDWGGGGNGILWTISINWHRWLLVNNHISKYNSFILVLYRRCINYVSVCPPPPPPPHTHTHFLAPSYATDTDTYKSCFSSSDCCIKRRTPFKWLCLLIKHKQRDNVATVVCAKLPSAYSLANGKCFSIDI